MKLIVIPNLKYNFQTTLIQLRARFSILVSQLYTSFTSGHINPPRRSVRSDVLLQTSLELQHYFYIMTRTYTDRPAHISIGHLAPWILIEEGIIHTAFVLWIIETLRSFIRNLTIIHSNFEKSIERELSVPCIREIRNAKTLHKNSNNSLRNLF